MAERKKHKPVDTEAARPANDTVGETLRAARLGRGMEVDAVSHSIHIRPTQLKAIEANDIESLPGMTYAVGFVRSYANFLGLNGAEIVHRFKAEQGHSPAQSRLSFPEPITESRVPDPMMVGVGAFLAVAILVLWTVYSNMHSGSKTADKIPPAPVVTSVADTLPPAAAASSPAATPASLRLRQPPAVAPAPVTRRRKQHPCQCLRLKLRLPRQPTSLRLRLRQLLAPVKPVVTAAKGRAGCRRAR